MNRKIERAKKFLLRYETSSRELEQINLEIQTLREKQRVAGSPKLDGMPKGNKHIDLSDYIVRLEQLIEEYERQRQKERQIMREVRRAIEKLCNPVDVKILSYRYIDFMTYEEIAAAADLDLDYIYKRHQRALERLEY